MYGSDFKMLRTVLYNYFADNTYMYIFDSDQNIVNLSSPSELRIRKVSYNGFSQIYELSLNL